MTREEIKKELSDVLLDLGGLSFSDVHNLLEEDSAVTFEGKELIEIAKHFYNLSKKGLWDSEKVCEFIEDKIDDYLFINKDWNAAQLNSKFIEDLRKAMED